MNKAFGGESRKGEPQSTEERVMRHSRGQVAPSLQGRAEKGKVTQPYMSPHVKFSSISSQVNSKKFLRIPQRQLVKTPGYQGL